MIRSDKRWPLPWDKHPMGESAKLCNGVEHLDITVTPVYPPDNAPAKPKLQLSNPRPCNRWECKGWWPVKRSQAQKANV